MANSWFSCILDSKQNMITIHDKQQSKQWGHDKDITIMISHDTTIQKFHVKITDNDRSKSLINIPPDHSVRNSACASPLCSFSPLGRHPGRLAHQVPPASSGRASPDRNRPAKHATEHLDLVLCFPVIAWCSPTVGASMSCNHVLCCLAVLVPGCTVLR